MQSIFLVYLDWSSPEVRGAFSVIAHGASKPLSLFFSNIEVTSCPVLKRKQQLDIAHFLIWNRCKELNIAPRCCDAMCAPEKGTHTTLSSEETPRESSAAFAFSSSLITTVVAWNSIMLTEGCSPRLAHIEMKMFHVLRERCYPMRRTRNEIEQLHNSKKSNMSIQTTTSSAQDTRVPVAFLCKLARPVFKLTFTSYTCPVVLVTATCTHNYREVRY